MRKTAGSIELVLAVLAVLGAVACWNAGVRTTEFAAVPDVSPAYTGTYYSGSWIAVAALAVTVGALVALDGVRRLLTVVPPHTG